MFLQTFTRNKAPPMLPESVIKEVREETEIIILSSYGEEQDCSMTDPFSIKELKDTLEKTKTKKAPGPDGITGEMLKHLGACSRAEQFF